MRKTGVTKHTYRHSVIEMAAVALTGGAVEEAVVAGRTECAYI